jgi:quercetin dioxygenase-like cupin family protein
MEVAMHPVLQHIPATEGVRKIGRGEGESFDVAGAHLTWKVRAGDSAFQFSVYEMKLAPGEGVPVHSHSSAESFYVLDGTADFYRVHNGEEDWMSCGVGELIILPPNSLHGFYNRGTSVCVVLGISTAAHQAFFDSVANADRESSFAKMPLTEAMGKIADIALQNHMYFAPIELSRSGRSN